MVNNFCKKEIRTDNRFRFHKGDAPAALVRSVEREGILLPLIAVGEAAPVLVDGYRRFGLLSDEDPVFIRVMKDEGAAVRAAVELNMLSSPYSEMEKAEIVAVVHKNTWMSDREILDTLLPRLGLKGRQSVLDSCLVVAGGLEPSLSAVLAGKKAPLKFAVRLAAEAQEEQLVLSEFFSGRRFSLSEMIQAYDMLVPVRKRENSSFSTIVAGLKETKGDALAALRQIRFPKATGIRTELNQLLLPYKGKLSFPSDLEGDAFHLSCRLKRPEAALECIRVLQKISEDLHLFRFLAEYLGDD